MGFDKYRRIINIINESIYLFVVFSIPLVFSPEEFLGFYQIPKEFILHFGANLLLILLPIIFILNPQKLISNIINNRLILFSILFILFSYAISTLFSISILGSLWGREYGMSGNSLQTFFSLSVISISVIVTNSDKSQIRRLFLAIFASSTIVGFVGLMQNFLPNIFETFTFYHQDRVVSTLGNPIYLGSYLLISNLLSIIYFFGFSEIKLKNKYSITLLIIALSVQISAIMLTLSRGPIISFFVGYIGITVAYFYLKDKSIKNLVIFFAIPILVSIAILNIPNNYEEKYFDSLVERSGSISKELELSIDIESGVNILSPNSFNYRGENWIGAFKLLKSWPTVLDNSNSNYLRMLVGYGPDTYIYVYPITVPIQERIVISSHAHNIFLNILIENGAIGFISIIFLIWVILFKLKYKFMNSNNSLKFIAISFGMIIVSRLIEQMLGVAVINDLLYFYLLICIVALFTQEEIERKVSLNLESSLVRNGLSITIPICILLSFVLTVKDYNSIISGFYFGKSIAQLNDSDVDNSIINLDKARELNNRSEYIQTELFKLSYKIYKYQNQRDSVAGAKLLARIYSTLLSHEKLEPYSFNTQNFLTQTTWELQLREPEIFREEAIGRYIRLRNLMPQYLITQEILSNVLVGVGEIELGKEEAKIGIRMGKIGGILSPQSWWVLGEAEKISGNQEEAIKAFEESIIAGSLQIEKDDSPENRAYAFLVLAHQSLTLIYESMYEESNEESYIEKAIFHIQKAQAYAYNSNNVLLLERRFQ